jgi:hypothetical protein
MARPRAADDFSAIRARVEELRQERVQQLRDEAAEPATDKRETMEKGTGRPLGRPDLGPLGRGRPFLR